MSDVVDQSHKPTQATAAARFASPAVWLVVLLFAAAAFAATVLWAGGIDEVLSLAGLDSLLADSSQNLESKPSKPASAPSSGASTSSVIATGSVSSPPPAVMAAMYREQLQSQRCIGELVDNRIVSLALGTPNVLSNSFTIPVTAKERDGSRHTGTMTLKKYDGTWYFFSLTASGGGTPASTGAIDSSVVSAITREQAKPANQDMIKNGVLGGGFKTATVTGVSYGAGTATVNFKMTGGTAPPKKGQFVLISKRDGATTYWFVARFSAR